MSGALPMIHIYADWQPAYMDSPPIEKTEDFKTMEDAEPTIKEWKKTACTVIVSEFEEKRISKYVWGKKVKG